MPVMPKACLAQVTTVMPEMILFNLERRSRFSTNRAATKLFALLRRPAGAVALLLDILQAMAAGRGATIIAEKAEISTVQAAEVLDVSWPFLIKLLEDGPSPTARSGYIAASGGRT